jgi:hypothetical protein
MVPLLGTLFKPILRLFPFLVSPPLDVAGRWPSYVYCPRSAVHRPLSYVATYGSCSCRFDQSPGPNKEISTPMVKHMGLPSGVALACDGPDNEYSAGSRWCVER